MVLVGQVLGQVLLVHVVVRVAMGVGLLIQSTNP
jgi:hypothetical protein